MGLQRTTRVKFAHQMDRSANECPRYYQRSGVGQSAPYRIPFSLFPLTTHSTKRKDACWVHELRRKEMGARQMLSKNKAVKWIRRKHGLPSPLVTTISFRSLFLTLNGHIFQGKTAPFQVMLSTGLAASRNYYVLRRWGSDYTNTVVNASKWSHTCFVVHSQKYSHQGPSEWIPTSDPNTFLEPGPRACIILCQKMQGQNYRIIPKSP
jgi:hypothetical protein